MSIRLFIESVNTSVLTQIHNTLSDTPVKKFAKREDAVEKTLAVVEAGGYKDIMDRDRLLADLKKAGIIVLPDQPAKGDKVTEEPATEVKKKGKAKKEKPTDPIASGEIPPPLTIAPAAPPVVAAPAPTSPPPGLSAEELAERGAFPELGMIDFPEGTPDAVKQYIRDNAHYDMKSKSKRRFTISEATEALAKKASEASDAAAKSAGATEKSEPKGPRLAKLEATTLGHIRDLVKQSGVEAEAHTDDLAKALEINLDLAANYCARLKEKGYITMEDDSAKEGEKLFIVKLTDLGRTTHATTTGRVPSDQPGPRSKFTGKRIIKLVKENPRRAGTHGHKSFELIEDGMTYEKYKEKGGRNNDLQWDIDHEYVKLSE